ncbi:DUF4835 family protein [Aquirufa ecclesiirivi]|uniref:DUF4835 family protein n=1 Tax=Aquirufa ecclesiirivi TaxID=2715124 RepID=A0ABT4JEF8_9BACT|nr:DUF4835 family protein [Aquirufa ecclesiirivi]MCZ2472785.1 DUF4835 family protein [Aquirufa ecclesiirivi]MCZ2474646.1 DUF4835 family protein [Aquirufa ecclesiirivi]MDF0694801.1 DUF4835 family protein [Aquirufa ecclesiirivi]NHC49527.1 DUF4835 family protein [Aquirufa ecclesiirivi]
MKSTPFFLSLILLLTSWGLCAQELQATVTINTEQLQLDQQRGSNQIYPELQRTMQDFLNGRRWSNDNFAPEEKIKVNINLLLTKATSQGDFEANARLQVLRPVFGTSYETIVLNIIDKNFNFKYLLGMPLTYNDNSFIDNLSAMLAYYAYLACAYQYDSFGKMGGDVFTQKLFNLTNLAQTSGTGWGVVNDVRSRVAISESLMNQQLQGIREVNYTYHRLLLDTYKDQPDETRKGILELLNQIRQINQIRPGAANIRIFFDAKADEIFSIMDEASPSERQQAFAYLSLLDPIRTETYRKLIR